MSETRKLAAILCSDVVGYSRLAGADEDRILARLRALRSDLIDPTVAVHRGRIVKRTGDGSIVEFRSVVDAVRCALEVQNTMVERNAGVPDDLRIDFHIGVHLGDVVEEADGDLMGDGVNIAARLEGICAPGAICLSEDAYRQMKGRLDLAVTDLGPTELKNIAEPIRVYSLEVGKPAQAKPASEKSAEGGRSKYDAANPGALKRLVIGGAQLRLFSQDILEACYKSTNDLYAQLSQDNARFKKIADSYMAFRADEYLWWQVAEYSFDNFMIRERRAKG
jgi:class 3 adenylate cyclase